MPLGSSVSANIREMANSPNHRKRVRKYGKGRARMIEIAAAENASRRTKKRRTSARKTRRVTRRR